MNLPLVLSRALRIPALLVWLPLLAGGLAAQSGTGTVVGYVTDSATRKALQGAVVSVAGTHAVAHTDGEGRFTLPALPTGRRRLEIDYVGLDPMSHEVDILAGQTQTVSISLSSEALKLEPVVVAAAARGQSLATNQQKTAAGILNIVSEEVFGQMIGGNIGYALQRLPGLTVDEDESGEPTSINIRGIAAEFNSFQIDGNRVPTSGDTRGLSTGQFAAEGISGIEVIKAATPDRDGDAMGGIINVITRSAFERDARELRLTGAGVYNDYDGKWGHQASASYSDIYSVGGKTKNLGITLTLSSTETPRNYTQTDIDYGVLFRFQRPDLTFQEPIHVLANTTLSAARKTARTRGFTGSFDYRLGTHHSFYLRPSFSRREDEILIPRYRTFVTTGHTNIVNPTLTSGTGTPTSGGGWRYRNSLTESHTKLFAASFGSKHTLGEFNLNFDGFLSRNNGVTDNSVNYEIRHNPPGTIIAYERSNFQRPIFTVVSGNQDLINTTAVSRGDLTLRRGEKTEDVFSVKGDLERKFVSESLSGAFKTGLKYRSSRPERDSMGTVYRTGTGAAFPYAQVLRRNVGVVNGNQIGWEPDLGATVALLKAQPNLFALQAAATDTNLKVDDYTAKEDTASAYVMGTFRKGPHQVIVGLRAERNSWEGHTFQIDERNTTSVVALNRGRDYTVWLPGIHFRHELRPNLILRESYNRSYARPELEGLITGREINFPDETMADGNPNLAPSFSHNFDLQLEYYTRQGGLFSASLFYKDMKGFYFETVRDEPVVVNGQTELFQAETIDNARGGKNFGVELMVQQRLSFLPKPFNRFHVMASATFSDSEGSYPFVDNAGNIVIQPEKLPVRGFSDKILYGALSYGGERLRVKASYRFRSEFFEDAGSFVTAPVAGAPSPAARNLLHHDFASPREQVDMEVSYRVSDKLEVFANVDNLTERPINRHQGIKEAPEDISFHSRRFIFGVTAKF
jgi:TonB-dependent receptor